MSGLKINGWHVLLGSATWQRSCGNATVLPEKGSYVEGVLWKITEAWKSLIFMKDFKFLWERINSCKNRDGVEKEVCIYDERSAQRCSGKAVEIFI